GGIGSSIPSALIRCSALLTGGAVSRFVIVALLLKCAAPGPTTAATIRPTVQSGATRVLVMRGSPWNSEDCRWRVIQSDALRNALAMSRRRGGVSIGRSYRRYHGIGGASIDQKPRPK